MIISTLLADKTRKATVKRELIAQALRDGEISVEDFSVLAGLDDKSQGIVLEAMEAVTNAQPETADETWLAYAVRFIDSAANNPKREASRVVGNIAHLFPDSLDAAVEKLLANTEDSGTVIRWSSAYALGRIIRIQKYAASGLFDILTAICEKEKDNGIVTQYLNGLKKAQKIR